MLAGILFTKFNIERVIVNAIYGTANLSKGFFHLCQSLLCLFGRFCRLVAGCIGQLLGLLQSRAGRQLSLALHKLSIDIFSLLCYLVLRS